MATVGTAVAGSGALLGTGAFSTVSAKRSFSVSSADDDKALLKIERGSGTEADEIVDNGSATVSITIPNVNENAYTAFDGLLKITNNSGGGSGSLNDIDIQSLTFRAEKSDGTAVSGALKVYTTGGDAKNNTDPIGNNAFNLASGLDNKISSSELTGGTLAPGDSVEVGILIDTRAVSASELESIANVIIAAETGDS